jgi:hypothetical protein
LILLSFASSARAADDAGHSAILKQIDVAPVWSVHRNGPPELLTRGGQQYVAYYDEERFLTVAQRRLGSNQWKFHRFPVQMGWATGSHAKLSIELDRAGHIHLSCYRRQMLQAPDSPPMALYYRSTTAHSIDEFEHRWMIVPEEYPHYPTHYTVGPTLFFAYRDGGSGRGNQLLNRYDDESRAWVREYESPLLDGQGARSAYVHGPGGPIPGPDGRFHLLWVWRETSDHATNHSLSYARTIGNDLHQWESAAGVPVSPPFGLNQRQLLVDGTPPGGGLSNVFQELAWDSKQRVVVSFHKFDAGGASQIYNARFSDGEWQTAQATQWNFIWGRAYSGQGAIGPNDYLRMERVRPIGNGELAQKVWNRDDGESLIILDEQTLTPLRVEQPPSDPAWRQAITMPESDFKVVPIPDLRRSGGPMQVHLIPDKDGADIKGITYFLRWENAGTNCDKAVPKPWPEPTMLRLYKIRSSD